jgi:hypothetical protein
MQFMKNKNGYVALISVLILGVLLLSILLSFAFRSIGGSKMVFSLENAHQARSMASLCANMALKKFTNDLYYAGGDSYAVENGNCDIVSVEDGIDVAKIIKVKGVAGEHVANIQIEIQELTDKIYIKSFDYVENF